MTKKAIAKRIIELRAKAEAYEYATMLVAHDYEHNETNVREAFKMLACVCRNEIEDWEEVLAE